MNFGGVIKGDPDIVCVILKFIALRVKARGDGPFVL